MTMSSEKGTSERLLSIDEVARRLGVVTTTVRRHLTQLRASGLQRVEIGAGSRLVRFREDSLNRMIRRAAEREESIIRDSVRSGVSETPVNA
jgi:DNA-binding IscR family transcriptional regulator